MNEKKNSHFLFISCDKTDESTVKPFVSALAERYEVFFDGDLPDKQEIPPMKKLEKCAAVLYFISDRSAISAYCKKILAFSLIWKKPLVGVLLQPSLPEGFPARFDENKLFELASYPTYAEAISAMEQKSGCFPPKKPANDYVFPPEKLLQPHVNPKFVPYVENYDELQEIVEVRLADLGVKAKVLQMKKGPTITQIMVEIIDDCPASRLASVANDLKRLLGSRRDIFVTPQIPGTPYPGIEVPNQIRQTVSFKEVVESPEYRNFTGKLCIALGKTASGEILIKDLAKTSGILAAGETGSGKSICIEVILASILMRYRPDEVKLIPIDLKQVEMGVFSGLPHMLFKEPLYELPQINNVLNWLIREAKERLALFASMNVPDIERYNAVSCAKRLPRLVVAIDEASELMIHKETKRTVESVVSMLASCGKDAGIHVVFATQNPVRDVITTEIYNSFDTKFAFAVSDHCRSMVILKAKGAERLLGYGDMLVACRQTALRAQCAYISFAEIEAIVDFIKERNPISFDEKAIDAILNDSLGQSSPTATPSEKPDLTEDEILAWKALKLCYDENNISCSFLQRKLTKGYNRIANILDYWEAEGYISKRLGTAKREFLVPASVFYARYRAIFSDDE